MTLADFCRAALLDITASPDRLSAFLHWRYDRLNREHPHAIFSVGEATPEFFGQTLAYVVGVEPIPETKPDDRPFRANYLDWCRKHLAECAT